MGSGASASRRKGGKSSKAMSGKSIASDVPLSSKTEMRRRVASIPFHVATRATIVIQKNMRMWLTQKRIRALQDSNLILLQSDNNASSRSAMHEMDASSTLSTKVLAKNRFLRRVDPASTQHSQNLEASDLNAHLKPNIMDKYSRFNLHPNEVIIYPLVGFVVKTKVEATGRKFFLNICHHEAVPTMAHTGTRLASISNMKVAGQQSGGFSPTGEMAEKPPLVVDFVVPTSEFLQCFRYDENDDDMVPVSESVKIEMANQAVKFWNSQDGGYDISLKYALPKIRRGYFGDLIPLLLDISSKSVSYLPDLTMTSQEARQYPFQMNAAPELKGWYDMAAVCVMMAPKFTRRWMHMQLNAKVDMSDMMTSNKVSFKQKIHLKQKMQEFYFPKPFLRQLPLYGPAYATALAAKAEDNAEDGKTSALWIGADTAHGDSDAAPSTAKTGSMGTAPSPRAPAGEKPSSAVVVTPQRGGRRFFKGGLGGNNSATLLSEQLSGVAENSEAEQSIAESEVSEDDTFDAMLEVRPAQAAMSKKKAGNSSSLISGLFGRQATMEKPPALEIPITPTAPNGPPSSSSSPGKSSRVRSGDKSIKKGSGLSTRGGNSHHHNNHDDNDDLDSEVGGFGDFGLSPRHSTKKTSDELIDAAVAAPKPPTASSTIPVYIHLQHGSIFFYNRDPARTTYAPHLTNKQQQMMRQKVAVQPLKLLAKIMLTDMVVSCSRFDTHDSKKRPCSFFYLHFHPTVLNPSQQSYSLLTDLIVTQFTHFSADLPQPTLSLQFTSYSDILTWKAYLKEHINFSNAIRVRLAAYSASTVINRRFFGKYPPSLLMTMTLTAMEMPGGSTPLQQLLKPRTAASQNGSNSEMQKQLLLDLGEDPDQEDDEDDEEEDDNDNGVHSINNSGKKKFALKHRVIVNIAYGVMHIYSCIQKYPPSPPPPAAAAVEASTKLSPKSNRPSPLPNRTAAAAISTEPELELGPLLTSIVLSNKSISSVTMRSVRIGISPESARKIDSTLVRIKTSTENDAAHHEYYEFLLDPSVDKSFELPRRGIDGSSSSIEKKSISKECMTQAESETLISALHENHDWGDSRKHVYLLPVLESSDDVNANGTATKMTRVGLTISASADIDSDDDDDDEAEEALKHFTLQSVLYVTRPTSYIIGDDDSKSKRRGAPKSKYNLDSQSDEETSFGYRAASVDEESGGQGETTAAAIAIDNNSTMGGGTHGPDIGIWNQEDESAKRLTPEAKREQHNNNIAINYILSTIQKSHQFSGSNLPASDQHHPQLHYTAVLCGEKLYLYHNVKCLVTLNVSQCCDRNTFYNIRKSGLDRGKVLQVVAERKRAEKESVYFIDSDSDDDEDFLGSMRRKNNNNNNNNNPVVSQKGAQQQDKSQNQETVKRNTAKQLPESKAPPNFPIKQWVIKLVCYDNRSYLLKFFSEAEYQDWRRAIFCGGIDLAAEYPTEALEDEDDGVEPSADALLGSMGNSVDHADGGAGAASINEADASPAILAAKMLQEDTEATRKFTRLLRRDEKVFVTGVVFKIERTGQQQSKAKRVLILTDAPRLIFIDHFGNIVRGHLDLSKENKPEAKMLSIVDFEVTAGGVSNKFASNEMPEKNAMFWTTKINAVINTTT